jgi:hypothetical protein
MQVSQQSEVVLSIVTQNLYLPLRKCLACSLPSAVRFWLDNFLLFAAAAADELIYFKRVPSRKFTKIATI